MPKKVARSSHFEIQLLSVLAILLLASCEKSFAQNPVVAPIDKTPTYEIPNALAGADTILLLGAKITDPDGIAQFTEQDLSRLIGSYLTDRGLSVVTETENRGADIVVCSLNLSLLGVSGLPDILSFHLALSVGAKVVLLRDISMNPLPDQRGLVWMSSRTGTTRREQVSDLMTDRVYILADEFVNSWTVSHEKR